MGDWPKEEISEGVFVDVDPESVIRSQAAEIARLREEVGRLGRDNNALKYGPEHFGGRMHQQVIDDLRADLDDARTALADAQAVGFAAGVEAAANSVKRHSDIARGEMSACYGQQAANSLGAWSAVVSHLDIEHDAIRALTPPDLTAAAARVLLADEKTVHKLCSELVKLVEAEEYAGTFEEWAESDQDEMVGFMQKALRALITEKGASAA